MPISPTDLRHPVDLACKLFWDVSPVPLLRRAFALAPDAELVAAPTHLVAAARRDADRVVRVRYAGGDHLLHAEFESRADRRTPGRVLAYHVGTWDRAGQRLPVESLVVLTGRPRATPSGLLHLPSPSSPTLTFRYRVLSLWDLPATALAETDLAALTPLGRDLNDDALRRAAREVERSSPAVAPDLLGVLFSLALHRGVPRRTVRVIIDERRVDMANWFREIADKAERRGWRAGRLEGLEEGRQEGRTEGERAAAEQILAALLENRAAWLGEALLPLTPSAPMDDLRWLASRLASPIPDADLLADAMRRLGPS